MITFFLGIAILIISMLASLNLSYGFALRMINIAFVLFSIGVIHYLLTIKS